MEFTESHTDESIWDILWAIHEEFEEKFHTPSKTKPFDDKLEPKLRAPRTSIPLSEIFRRWEKSLGFQNVIKWENVLFIGGVHILGIYWSSHYALPVKWQTVLFASIMALVNGFGITMGAHRLFTHRSYIANLPLRLLLLVCFTAAGQNSVKQWVLDHRTHNKYSDTNADPHNANRGLFFSHIGWLMIKKNEEVLQKVKKIDMSDIDSDPYLMFQHRYFVLLKTLFCFFLPTMTGIWLWDEEWKCAVAWQCCIRFIGVLHYGLTVNSLAHLCGYKPCNNIRSAENSFVATCTLGEDRHNYHHAFSFDYKAAEHFDFFNFSAKLIRFFAYIGWAKELEEPSPQIINSITKGLSDGTPVHIPIERQVNSG